MNDTGMNEPDAKNEPPRNDTAPERIDVDEHSLTLTLTTHAAGGLTALIQLPRSPPTPDGGSPA